MLREFALYRAKYRVRSDLDLYLLLVFFLTILSVDLCAA